MKLWDLVRAQEWPFWMLFGLMIAESIFALHYHILMCNLPLADTLLLMVSLFHHQNTRGETAAPLFQRICGCVSYCAIIFVNASHALEMMTETIDKSSGHGHSHDHGSQKGHEGHEGHEHSFIDRFYSCIVPAYFVPVIVADVIIKWILLCANRLPPFSLNRPLQVFLHMLVPIAVFTLYGVGFNREMKDFPLLSYLDPVTTIFLCIISAAMIVPAFREMKPYVFADTPLFFDTDKFTNEISTQFEGIQCTHIHVYRIWPNQNFEALIHVNIEVNKSEEKWSEFASKRYSDISKFIRSALMKGGAEKVVIEPRFIDRSIDNPEWQGCVGAKCYVEDRGCCSVVNSTITTEA
ncbi:hypothetical protein PFISCL1PPCAC_26615 [Pristionchus fissidentatus]|uniref:G protein-coupled receptor n=1 Tax=Pristionchus fissidentatus TaxID=1538716 RepID=A0AAV5WX80_9BILA|nr:hypothetical protein PFISCL1PPCAC_26615 [Pristionchus fissidentatus]